MSQQNRRSLRLEALEHRQMLAADLMFVAPAEPADISGLQVDLGDGYFFQGFLEDDFPLASTPRDGGDITDAVVELQTREGSRTFTVPVRLGGDIETALRKAIAKSRRPHDGLPPAEGEAAPGHPPHHQAPPHHRGPGHHRPNHAPPGPATQVPPPAREATVALPTGPLASTPISNPPLGVATGDAPASGLSSPTVSRTEPSAPAANSSTRDSSTGGPQNGFSQDGDSLSGVSLSGVSQGGVFQGSASFNDDAAVTRKINSSAALQSPVDAAISADVSFRSPLRYETHDGFQLSDSSRSNKLSTSEQRFGDRDGDWDSFFDSENNEQQTIATHRGTDPADGAHAIYRAEQADLALAMMAIAAPPILNGIVLSQEAIEPPAANADQAWTQRYGLTDVALVEWTDVPGTEWIAVSQTDFSANSLGSSDPFDGGDSDSQLATWHPLATKAGIAIAALAAVARERRGKDGRVPGRLTGSTFTSALRRKRPR
ncbi:MAG TPA: hypothetical protein DDW52_15595 [Planctomycetaceae bacterium]|nr:hypothetical protein [Planctomycetaceae bacterium]